MGSERLKLAENLEPQVLQVRSRLLEALSRIVEAAHPGFRPIRELDDLVDDLGLESLDLAELIAVMEIEFDLDPFARIASIRAMRKVGDLLNAYEAAVASPKGSEAGSDDRNDRINT